MNLRIDLEVVTVERQSGDLLFIEGRTGDGNQAAFYLRLAALGGEAPQVGQRLALSLTAAQAAPSLRERMQAPRTQASPPLTMARSQATAPQRQDATGELLAGILGTTTSLMRAAVGERDVDDELNALLGPPRGRDRGT